MSSLQGSLFDAPEVSFDPDYRGLERIQLDPDSWLDVLPEWIRGADALFEQLVKGRSWGQRTRMLYDQRVIEPRLTAPWSLDSGEPLSPPILEDLRRSLSARYAVEFDSVGFNFYRDGRDSVAWHRDKIRKEIPSPIVPLVSLGERRRFLVRPWGGGASRAFMLGRGDLLVTGGQTQRAWEHSVPKVAHAGPRISLAFRYGMMRNAYGTLK